MVLSKEEEQELIERVKEAPYFLRHIETQTEAICLEAVKRNAWVLYYVKNQTEQICLEAVKQSGMTLEHVKKQTPEICLEAVKQNGLALEYVQEQTDEICLEAIKQNQWALYYVNNQIEELCLTALYGGKGTYDGCLEDLTGDYTTHDDVKLYGFIKSPTTEMKEVNEILKKNNFSSYRQTRAQLVNKEISLTDSPYHVLEQLHHY